MRIVLGVRSHPNVKFPLNQIVLEERDTARGGKKQFPRRKLDTLKRNVRSVNKMIFTDSWTLSTLLFCYTWVIVTPAVDGQLPIDSDRFQCPSYDCDWSNCHLPNCLCANVSAPLGLPSEIVPQFVVLTFNDVVNREFYDPVTNIFKNNRRNPTGRRIAATMFVSDEEGTGQGQGTTDYCLVRKYV